MSKAYLPTLTNDQKTELRLAVGLPQLRFDAPPLIATVPPTLTKSTASASTTITNPQAIPYEHGSAYFSTLGQTPGRDINEVSFPGQPGLGGNSASPWAIEFYWDTENGEIEFSVQGGIQQLLIDGELASENHSWEPVAFDGNDYRLKAADITAGVHLIRLNMSGNTKLRGVTVGPSDTIAAAPKKLERWGFAGDSFTEPTISDATTGPYGDGYTDIIGYILGINPICGAKGATGWVTTASGSDNMIFRLPRLLEYDLDRLVFALGINDTLHTKAQVQAAAAANIALAKAAGLTRRDQIIVLSPWWPKGEAAAIPAIWDINDAMRDAAAAADVLFVDLLHLPLHLEVTAGTVTTASTAGGSAVIADVEVPAGGYLRVGSEGKVEVRKVVSVSGSGPYTHGLAGDALASSHGIGEMVQRVGRSFITGTGTIADPANNGNADRYILGDSDPTHFTYAGHRAAAIVLARLITEAIEAA